MLARLTVGHPSASWREKNPLKIRKVMEVEDFFSTLLWGGGVGLCEEGLIMGGSRAELAQPPPGTPPPTPNALSTAAGELAL